MKRSFSYKDLFSDKFWSIELQEQSITVHYGKTGTMGVKQTKEADSVDSALREYEQLIKQKLKKGYKEVAMSDNTLLDDAQFWALLERAKNKADSCDEIAHVTQELLCTLSPSDIKAFDTIFRNYFALAYQSRLWAAAYVINGGCSDDGFDYFRAWLIARGKKTFHNTLQDPEYLVKIISLDDAGSVGCEDMLYAAQNAYVTKTGQELAQSANSSVPQPELQIEWQEDEDELKHMVPKLCKKYWNA